MSLDRTVPTPHRSPPPEAAEGPKSPAWIEAEHAFAPVTRALPAATTAVVIVKRRRAVVLQSEALAGDRAAGSAPSPDALQPRVFRLPSARPDGTAPPLEAGPGPGQPARRRRAAAADRRPGPVAHTVVEPPAAPAEPALDSRALNERLAELEPILDAIRTARAFRFADDRAQAEWHRLSGAADRLLGQITRRG